MKRRIAQKIALGLLGLVFLFCPSIASAVTPQITVSATAVTLLGSNQTISITVTLNDPNHTGLMKIIGTSIIPPGSASTVTPGSTATVGPIWGSDVIADAYGNPNTTYYKVQVFTVSGGIVASTPVFSGFYQFAGSGTVDLSTATPLAPSFFAGPSGSVSIPGNVSVAGTLSVTGATALGSITGSSFDVSANTLKNATNTAAHYLRNNGSQYVDSTIQASDVPALVTLTENTGSGSANYTTTSTGYVNVDTTNLCRVVTIPIGSKLLIAATGNLGSNTGVAFVTVSVADIGTTCAGGGTTPLREVSVQPSASGIAVAQPFKVQKVLAGDGAAHAISIQYKTGNASDAATIENSSATLTPVLTLLLIPSN